MKEHTEARSAPERSEGSKPESSYPEIPDTSQEGLAPAREWVLMVESETGHIACGCKEWPKGVHSEPMSGCKYIRVREVLPVSPSLEAPKTCGVHYPHPDPICKYCRQAAPAVQGGVK